MTHQVKALSSFYLVKGWRVAEVFSLTALDPNAARLRVDGDVLITRAHGPATNRKAEQRKQGKPGGSTVRPVWVLFRHAQYLPNSGTYDQFLAA